MDEWHSILNSCNNPSTEIYQLGYYNPICVIIIYNSQNNKQRDLSERVGQNIHTALKKYIICGYNCT